MMNSNLFDFAKEDFEPDLLSWNHISWVELHKMIHRKTTPKIIAK